MHNGPMNRLEPHWPETTVAEAGRFSDERDWSGTLRGWDERLEDFMAEHPTFTLVAAGVLGIVLGLMVKRR